MRPQRMTADELLTEVEHLTRHGVPADEIARRLGRKLNSLARAMYRAGRRDLVKLFHEESIWRSKRRASAGKPTKEAYQSKIEVSSP